MLFFSKKMKTVHQKDLLIEELNQTKIALESAYSNFENVIDPDLIDCYIFELNAVQQRYKFLLKEAKNLDSFCPMSKSIV
ncbi:MAG TPA: YaaL family protein [Clostridiales bacterium]|nr:YaaL family protein [Clostridiales bacterium]